MRRRIVISFVLLAAVASACGARDEGTAPQTKNAGLFDKMFPVLVNGSFAEKGGGWIGQGFKLGKGCQDSDPKLAYLPSLTWEKNKLTFGNSRQSVVQSIAVPLPMVVTFSVDAVLADVANSYEVTLSDDNESKVSSSGDVRLTVTTSRRGEMVKINLTGVGAAKRACSGPYFKNARLDVAAIATTTTTSTTTTTLPTVSTTAPITSTTSTTSTSTTTTTIRSTTTAPTTPVAPVTPAVQAQPCQANGRCVVGNRGPGTGLIYAVYKEENSGYEDHFEIAPSGWAGGSGDPVVDELPSRLLLEKGIRTTSGQILPSSTGGDWRFDWHIPSIQELQQVYDAKVDPTLSGEYRSKTTTDSSSDYLWFFNFDTGQRRPAKVAEKAKVRPVRRAPVPCALGGKCAIGDVGPLGGKVFYVTTPDKPILTGHPTCESTLNPCLYMEVAQAGWSGTPGDPLRYWANPMGCCSEVPNNGAKGTAIGTGYANTQAIGAQQRDFEEAAEIAKGVGAQSNWWYLPSQDELLEVFKQGARVGAPTSGQYWTSTEHSKYVAIAIDFANGAVRTSQTKEGYGNQHYGLFVRPVRAFAPSR
jgi:hypothetical protein